MTTKAEMLALERVWEREVSAALRGGPHVLVSKAKVFTALEADGLIQRDTWTMRDRFGISSVYGWTLTHAGRLLYCSSCTEPPSTRTET